MKEEYVMSPNGGKRIDKATRYGWNKNHSKGSGNQEMLDKHLLDVDWSYQRDPSPTKVLGIASNLQWEAFGTITVSQRENGKHFIIDGQHRWEAAKKHSDIKYLPCIVFTGMTVQEEAARFAEINSNRWGMLSIYRFKADIRSEDENSLYVKSQFDKRGIVISRTPKNPLEIKSVVRCCNMAKENKQKFEITLDVITELHSNSPIRENLLAGLYYLSKNMDGDISDKKFKDRLINIGPKTLLENTYVVSQGCGSRAGSQLMWAVGILNAVNKGLKNKYKMKIDNMIEK